MSIVLSSFVHTTCRKAAISYTNCPMWAPIAS